MSKEELIEYLKNNLTLSAEYEGGQEYTINLQLGDDVISSVYIDCRDRTHSSY